jgi:5-methylcytosine-specific restriction endonuclease McrA
MDGQYSKHHGRSSRKAKANRDELYELGKRLNLVCWICKEPIDYDAPANHPNAFEADHVIPRSKDMTLAEERANLAPSHCRCNRSRGNKAPLMGLGQRSRIW